MRDLKGFTRDSVGWDGSSIPKVHEEHPFVGSSSYKDTDIFP